jgi:hypothetical protein
MQSRTASGAAECRKSLLTSEELEEGRNETWRKQVFHNRSKQMDSTTSFGAGNSGLGSSLKERCSGCYWLPFWGGDGGDYCLMDHFCTILLWLLSATSHGQIFHGQSRNALMAGSSLWIFKLLPLRILGRGTLVLIKSQARLRAKSSVAANFSRGSQR